MSVRDLTPADAARRARQAAATLAAAQSADLRLARTGSNAPPHGDRGRATQAAQCRALVQQYAPAWSEATLDKQATALWKAWMRARRNGWTAWPLAQWAAYTLTKGGA